jgi:hypothetical protein
MSSYKFCSNPNCQFHIDVPFYRHEIYLERNTIINHHLYTYHNNKKQFYLCDLCHEAVQFIEEVKRNRL